MTQENDSLPGELGQILKRAQENLSDLEAIRANSPDYSDDLEALHQHQLCFIDGLEAIAAQMHGGELDETEDQTDEI